MSPNLHGSKTLEDQVVMPIAIIGMSGRYPGDASNPEKLWELISEGRSAMTEVPANRFNVDAFYHPHSERPGTINARGGHFMAHTHIEAFDAPFFSITPNEASAMDPQQRIALECAYEAMENAGLPMNSMIGSDTSVYIGSFSKDYSEMLSADQENLPSYMSIGNGTAILSNRISWFFDLKGPSISIDTACSSALVALHLACQSLRTGESQTSIVGGVNIILVPSVMAAMSNLGFLSPDSICHSFDDKANGYARGEGASFIVLKPLSHALRDHDMIRGIIRNTGINQDGNTPGITVPSAESQETLIRKCYAQAQLPLCDTQYVEAHGTGTQAGDPQEALALSKTLGLSRSAGDPLLIGSIKTNIGHLEGASGLAQVTKAVFSLEKGFIPSNLWYQKANERIQMQAWNLKVVDEMTPWPTAGPRRISINSFGYGGTNAHCIIDDAYHFLQQRDLVGNHITVKSVENKSVSAEVAQQISISSILDTVNVNEDEDEASMIKKLENRNIRRPMKLFVWTSNEQSGIERITMTYRTYITQKQTLNATIGNERGFMAQFARTLSSHRSILPWKQFAVASSFAQLCHAFGNPDNKPLRSSRTCKIGFIFTGQGAQWHAMGRALLTYPVFKGSLLAADVYLRSIGCSWSLVEEFMKGQEHSEINCAEYSQPICTALQIAMVELLKSWGVTPCAVVGHSSGEIAAAYTIGALSQHDAWLVSYHRGRLSNSIKYLAPASKGGMLVTGLGADAVGPYISKVKYGLLNIACKNSPVSTTVSGDLAAIEEMMRGLIADGQFARLLSVDTAYHSAHMNVIAEAYLCCIQNIEPRAGKNDVKMFSSVTGGLIESESLDASYWVRNMVQEVDFVTAVQSMCRSNSSIHNTGRTVDVLVELGPHSALQGPLKQILKMEAGKSAEISYISALVRGVDACVSSLNMAGMLFQLGYPIDIAAINLDEKVLGKDSFLVDMPPMAWNRNNTYWGEPGISKNFRFRADPRTDLLGAIVPLANKYEPIYRNIIKLSDQPWISHHKVQGSILYPAAGMLVAAIEAARQNADTTRVVDGYELRDVNITNAIIIHPGERKTEIMLTMRPLRSGSRSDSLAWDEFHIVSKELDEKEWISNCNGLIKVKYESTPHPAFENESKFAAIRYRRQFEAIKAECYRTVDLESHAKSLANIGLEYSGPFVSFTSISKGNFQSHCSMEIPNTRILMPKNFEFSHIIHPCTLDCVMQMAVPGATSIDESLKVGLVPTSIDHLYVSSRIPTAAGVPLHGATKVEEDGFGRTQGSIIVYDDAGNLPVMTIRGIGSTPLRLGKLGLSQTVSMRKLIAYFHWQEDVTKMSSAEIRRVCTSALAGIPSVETSVVSDLEHAAYIYMRRLICSCTEETVKQFQPHFRKFYQLMQIVQAQVENGEIPHQRKSLVDWRFATPEYEADILERVKSSSSDGAAVCRHGENLEAIMKGDLLGIQVMMEESHLTNVYQSGVGCAQAYAQLVTYVDMLAHKNPIMKILEIGAGTGSITLPILQKLEGQSGTSPRFSNYVFTDISTGFFERAQEKLRWWLPWLTFARLDIEQDPMEQSFKEGEYDLILAANVLHATSCMSATLNHTRKLLKPEGKLVLCEVTNPLLRSHMIVGALEGWWVGEKDGREWGPTMTELRWHQVLKQNSFSGVDLALQDTPNSDDQFYSIIVSTAQKAPSLLAAIPPIPKMQEIIVVQSQTNSHQTRDFIYQITSLLQGQGAQIHSLSLDDTINIDVSNISCIFVLDCEGGQPVLPNIGETEFKCLKQLLLRAAKSTWVTRGAMVNSEWPKNNLMTGMARCIRAENPSICLMTVDLDSSKPIDTPGVAASFLKIYNERTDTNSNLLPDWEYAIRDGKILVARILLEKPMNDLLSSFLVQPKPELVPFGQDNRPLMLETQTTEESSFQFVDDDRYKMRLESDTIEIVVKVVVLDAEDRMSVANKPRNPYMGLDCSGVISRIGSHVNKFQVGDRVMTWIPGAFRTFARSPEAMCMLIPKHMSFDLAALMPFAFTSAYYSLFELGKLKSEDTLLVHKAADSIGLAAVILAKQTGAKIFATVSSAVEKGMLISQHGLLEEDIFNSQDDNFVEGVMRRTNGKGVDVILNTLTGDLLMKSWGCVALFGRFVELGHKDIENNTWLDMAPFQRNASFHSVNLVGLLRYSPVKCSEVFQRAMALACNGSVDFTVPMTGISLTQLTEATTSLRSGQNTGNLLVTIDQRDIVPIARPKFAWMTFRSDVTYLLAGGLGGLGRSLAEWMIRQGARNIAFLSRSGTSSLPARVKLDRLNKLGATLRVYRCDVSNAVEVHQAIAQCGKDLPPIKGCIQSAMILQDAIFENMTHKQFLEALRPKFNGTWNLHESLPQNLDFFVMLSSSVGIAGSRGQSNYAAGNTFQDAMANYRRGKGLAASTIDLGVVLDVGFVAESKREEVAKNTKSWSYAGLRETELHILVQSSITGISSLGQKAPAQIISGLGTGGMANLAGFKLPWWFDDSKFAHIKHTDTHQFKFRNQDDTVQLKSLLSGASTSREAADIVSVALVRKLSKVLMVEPEDIELTRPISRYGVDSLLAVEIRAWIFTEIQSDISVFQLLSKVPIIELVNIIVSKSKLISVTKLAHD